MIKRHHRSIGIDTFHPRGRYTVELPLVASTETEDVLKALGEALKLKESSLKIFALYIGELGQPIRKLEKGEKVPLQEPICLQRTGLDTNKELKIIRSDEEAAHLLYSEIIQNPQLLHPTDEEKQLLDEYSDPSFPTERQYLETAIKIRGYTSTRLQNCTIKSNLEHRGKHIPSGTTVTCTCYEETLEIQSEDSGTLAWEWKLVKRWKLDQEDEASFELCNEVAANASILQWVTIKTNQAQLLLQVAFQNCTSLLYKLKPSLKPIEPCPGHQGQQEKGFGEYMNIILFGAGRNFTSIENVSKK